MNNDQNKPKTKLAQWLLSAADWLLGPSKKHVDQKSILQTSFGRWSDRTTYRQLGKWMIVFNAVSGLLYWMLNFIHSGTKPCNISLLDSLYFSLVTFTSLGNNEISAVGLGKILTIIQVLAGLLLVALFVGKLASEKQAAQLLLLSTSEQQRRLREFCNAIDELSEKLQESFDVHDHEEVLHAGKRSVRVLASTSSYLNFQSREGGITEYGNVPALRALYKAAQEIQLKAITILKIRDTPEGSRNTFRQLNERAVGICLNMIRYHTGDSKSLGVLEQIGLQDAAYKTWLSDLGQGTVKWEHNTKMSERLIEKVFVVLPPHPWPKDVDKSVAEILSITKLLARRCIEELIRRNRWPDYKKTEY